MIRFIADRFAFEASLLTSPVATYTAIQTGTALVFAALCWRLATQPLHSRIALVLVLLAGLALRAMFIGSEPVLESDFYRYLWDGATTLSGHNPWAWSPAQILGGDAPAKLDALARFSTPVVERINHPDVTTIYPPVAQAFFGLAAWLKPLDLDTWRWLLLGAETVSCLLLLALLRQINRPAIWVAMWWLNPLVIKETMNTAHVDVLLVPLVLGALLAIIRGHRSGALACIFFATGIKLWPAMLALWVFTGSPIKRWCAGGITGGLMVAAMAAPLVLFKTDATTGLIAYSTGWDTNAGVFALVRELATLISSDANRVARIMTALALLLVLTRTSWHQAPDSIGTIRQIALAILALLLLSPAVYPWYVLWIAPFIALVPRSSMIALTTLVSLYYLRFYLAPRDAIHLFTGAVAIVEFAPVVLLLAVEFWRGRWSARQPA